MKVADVNELMISWQVPFSSWRRSNAAKDRRKLAEGVAGCQPGWRRYFFL